LRRPERVVKPLVPLQTSVNAPKSSFKPASNWLPTAWELLSAVAVTLAAVVLTEVVREYFSIPNPLVLTLLAVIFVTVQNGMSAGLVSSAIVGAYGIVVFLLRDSIPTPTTSVSRELMICVVAPATAIMVGALKGRQEKGEKALRANELTERIALEREHNARLLAEGHEAQLRLLAAELERGVAERTAELRESEQRYQLLAMQAPVGIFHTDAGGSFTFVNERFCSITLITHLAALGDGWQQVVHPDDRIRVTLQWLAAARSGRAFRMEFRLRSLAGETLWVEATAEAVRNEIGAVTGYIGSVHDLSERKHAEDALRALSLRDDLTGVWNRRGFYKLAEREVQRAKARGLTLLAMYADVNSLKSINDDHGHGAGDDAILAAAVALQSACRGIDIVGRLGGDEFVILSVHETSDAARAAETAMRARIGTNTSAAADDRPYSLTVSVGAAISAGENEILDSLLARADQALYAAKRGRRVTLTQLAVAS